MSLALCFGPLLVGLFERFMGRNTMIREWKKVTHFMNNGINIHKNSYKGSKHRAGKMAQQAKLLLGKADGSDLRVACQEST